MHRGHRLGHQRFEEPHDGQRDHETGERAEHGEHEAFEQELPDQSAPSSTDRPR
jgi:hypothetical protein